MRKLGSFLFSLVLTCAFIAGMGLIAYPTLADSWNKWQASESLKDYDSMIAGLSNDTTSQLIEEARAYNEELLQVNDRYHPSEELHARYLQTLNPGQDGIMGSLYIPKISVSLPIYHGTDENSLQNGIGHLEGSSLPAGGINTHSVLSGHTGLTSAKILTDLDQLEAGDLFQVSLMSDTLTYEVYATQVVEPDQIGTLDIEPGEDKITLVTCTPYGINTHRLLVSGARVEVDDQTIAAQKPAWWKQPQYLILAAMVLALLVLVIVLIRKLRNRSRQRV